MGRRSDPWFKCFPEDWLEDTRKLTPEQRGLYFDALCLIYRTDGNLCDDDLAVAHVMHVHWRKWRSAKDVLIERGFLSLDGQRLTNKRAHKVLMERAEKRQKLSKNSAKRWHKSDTNPENTDKHDGSVIQLHPDKNVNEVQLHSKSRQIDRKIDSNTPLPPKGDMLALEAFKLWNEAALRLGLQQASKLTPDRKRKLMARLADYGMDGWEQALANIEPSKFLRGLQGDRKWRCSFDFLVSPAGFSKVHDGVYTDKSAGSKYTFSTRTVADTQKPDDVEIYRTGTPEFAAECERLYEEGLAEDAERIRDQGWVKLKQSRCLGELAERILKFIPYDNVSARVTYQKAAKE